MATVLLVDDSPVARRVLSKRLAAEGFVVAQEASAAGARGIDAKMLACAIVDLELADGDGVELASALLASNASLAIAFFTGGAPPESLARASERGPVFCKPDLEPVIAWVKARSAPRSDAQPPPTK
ncbi:MAG: response regulator [Myxococcota bacterium]|nr:response regulator [Myxococcota bacterium]